jgi:zinc transport system substrate-binding protein
MFRIFVLAPLLLLPIFAKPLVVVSILPQQYIVEKIAADTIDVLVMAGVGTNHETYEPKPNQMKALSAADIYFFIGLPFERTWLERFKSFAPNMKIADMSLGIEKMEFAHHHDEHNERGKHNEHNEHDDDELDPHIWLDPELLKTQASNVLLFLSEKYPKNANLYNKNYNALVEEFDKLNKEINSKLSKLANRSFLTFHPSLGYFAKRYDLKQISVEFEGKEPKAKEILEVVKQAKAENIKVLFVEPQISDKSASIISKETKADMVKLDLTKKDVILTLKEITGTLLRFNSAEN